MIAAVDTSTYPADAPLDAVAGRKRKAAKRCFEQAGQYLAEAEALEREAARRRAAETSRPPEGTRHDSAA
jgi:hypothetical protein